MADMKRCNSALNRLRLFRHLISDTLREWDCRAFWTSVQHMTGNSVQVSNIRGCSVFAAIRRIRWGYLVLSSLLPWQLFALLYVYVQAV